MLFMSSYASSTILAEQNTTKEFSQEKDFDLATGDSWLSGWDYRLKHEITGGADENTTVNFRVWYDEVTVTFATNAIGQPTNEVCRPMAIYYNGATYLVWQGGDNTPDIFIIYYDHVTGEWSDEVNIAWSGVTDDAHMAPAITVDNNGYIHVFWFHDSVDTHYKSDNPENITAWTQQDDVAPDWSSYPHVFSAGNKMYMIYQTSYLGSVDTRDVWIIISSDNGATWGTPQQIILNYEGVTDYGNYLGTIAWDQDDKIHMVWQHVEVQAVPLDMWRRHVFHAYYDIDDAHMYDVEGVDLGSQISYAEAMSNCLVVNTGSGMDMSGAVPDVLLDEVGRPWISYTAGERNETEINYDGNFTQYHTRWTGTEWITPEAVTNTGHAFNYMCLNYHNDLDVDAFAVVSPWGGVNYWGGDIQKWHWDGETWTYAKMIMAMNVSGVPLQYPNIPYNRDLELDLVFVEEVFEDYDGDLRVYASGVSSLGTMDEISVGRNSNEDFSDLRFTLDDGVTPLDYWISDFENASYADVWLKIPDLTEECTIYMYLGNNTVTTESNLSIMNRYDDGIVGNLDNATNGDVSITHTDGKLTVTMDSTDDAFAIGGVNTDWNKYMSVTVDPHSGTSAFTGTTRFGYFDAESIDDMLGVLGTVYYYGRFFIARYHGQETSYQNQTTVSFINAANTIYYWDPVSGWLTGVYRYDSQGVLEYQMWDDGTTLYADILQDGESIFTGGAGIPTVGIAAIKSFSDGIVYAMAEHYTDAYYFYTLTMDNYFIRDYIDPEPIQGLWGPLESTHSWHTINSITLLFEVPFSTVIFDGLLIFLGLALIPFSTVCFVWGGKKGASMDKLFFALIAFVIGWALLLGGIM